MYGIEFENEIELLEYMNGGFILSDTPSTPFFYSAIRYRPRIEFLQAVNLFRIDTAKQFESAFEIAEHIVECKILGINHRVKIGERVLLHQKPDSGKNVVAIPATVVSYDKNKMAVHVISESYRGPVNPSMLQKIF